MLWVHLLLSRLTKDQQMMGDLPNVAVVNEQFRFGDANGEDLSNELPGYGVLVSLIDNEPFHIDQPIDDSCRVVVVFRKRQQVR